MKVKEKSHTPEGIVIQIEDWSDSFPKLFKTLCIGAYPKAVKSSRSKFGPREGNIFRVDINRGFETHDEVQDAFNDLKQGNKKIIDFADMFWNIEDKDYL